MKSKTLIRNLILATTIMLSMPSVAAVPVDSTDYLNKALEGYITRLEETKKLKLLPRISDSKDAPALEALWNVPAIIGTAPYRGTDLPALMDIIQQQAQITKTYVLFSPDANKQPDPERNSIAYQDEISRSSVAMLGFITAALEASEDYALTLEKNDTYQARLAGVQKLRLGLQQVINGTALMLRNPDLKPENKERLMLALADSAPAISAAVSIQDRKTLMTIIEGAKPNLSITANAAADRFIKAMQSTDCTGLCALH